MTPSPDVGVRARPFGGFGGDAYTQLGFDALQTEPPHFILPSFENLKIEKRQASGSQEACPSPPFHFTPPKKSL